MHVVADGSGTRHVALAGDGDEMRLLDSASGESTRRAAGDLSRVEADPLAVAAEGVPSAAREALGVEDWRAVGLVAVAVVVAVRVGVLVSVGFVAFFVLLAMAGVRDGFLLRLFAAWFVVNGVFAAGLARLAGARWDSTAVGGLVAWMTSVNPLLAPGWFTGYVELRHTSVNVSDISTLNELLSDEETPIRTLIGQMFDVPLFRLIMIVAMTNVGSMIASLLFAVYVLPLFATEIGGVDGVTRLMIEGARNSAELLWRTIT